MNDINNGITLYYGDCLKEMKKIKDKSIDMILCDLPYGTTNCKWDIVIPFEELWEQYKRILKLDGTIVLFGSQPFTSELVHSNINWFSHSWVWEKEQGTNQLLCKVQPLKIHEDIVVFSRPDNYDLNNFKELRNIFKNIMIKIGKNKKQIIDDLGQGLDHCFRCDSLQWGLPTEKNYNRMIGFYNLKDVPEYKLLKEMYEKDFKGRSKVYNPQMTVGKSYTMKRNKKVEYNPITDNYMERTDTINKGERYPTTIIKFNRELKNRFHPTQKPVALLEYLIKTYTNENDVILDNCMGGGSTGIACINTNRKFIGIEKDEKYYNVAKNRIEEHLRKE